MEKVDERRLTTADLAAAGRSEASRTAERVRDERDREEDRHPFFPRDEADGFRAQWRQVQEEFVDDPRAATQKADGLVASVIQKLAEVFAHERGRLEGEWSRGGDVTTEDLRVALQRYRAFFDRLLSVSAGLESAVAGSPEVSKTSRPLPAGASVGTHPTATAVGAAGGAAVGAKIGSAAGPVGTAAGLAAGAVAGGAAGKVAAEAVNPTAEDEYWRTNYATRPYVKEGVRYETYQPAYQYGWESYARYRGRRFEEVEPTLRENWEGRTDGRTGWDKVRDAVRDAWHRVERAIPGDADRDGR
jgi:hypothetical protein